MGNLIEVRNVVRTIRMPRTSVFGHERSIYALRGVSLNVRVGEALGIIGESGAGKSTLARLIMGLERPQHGDILYNGTELESFTGSQRKAFKGDIQIVFQDPKSSLDPRLKVRNIIVEPLRSLGIMEDHTSRLYEVLEAVHLSPDVADRYPHEFSGGQRQRIAIARALAPRPRVLVADEPISALDVSIQAQILNLLRDLKEQFSLTLILIAHDLSVVYHVCDRVAVMQSGLVVEMGSTQTVFRKPEHPYTQKLLASIPSWQRNLSEIDGIA